MPSAFCFFNWLYTKGLFTNRAFIVLSLCQICKDYFALLNNKMTKLQNVSKNNSYNFNRLQ